MNIGSESCSMDILANRGLRSRQEPSIVEPTTTLSGQPAEWLRVVMRRLEALAKLETGWDGRSAPRVGRSNILTATRLLQGVMRSGTPIPEFVPTIRGGIQIEWHVPQVDIELEIVTPWRYVLSFEDRETPLEFEDRELNTDLSAFREAVERISPEL